jgi:copper(I)-binding protein
MHGVARRAARVGLVLVLVLAVAGPASAAGQPKQPSASSGWVKLPAAGETTATAFVSVDNPTMYAIYLLFATADVAGKVEMREMDKDGAEKREPVTEVTVPAYGGVEMGPKGLHLVLSDLKRPLKEGETVVLSVTTEAGTRLDVAAPVQKEEPR